MSLNAIHGLMAATSAAIVPPKRFTGSQWARENFRLSGNSAVQGRFKPWKFQRGILDAMTDPLYEQVTVIKSARTGYTISLMCVLGAYAENDPCPVILLMPTDDDARSIAVDEVDPAFSNSPVLKGLLDKARADGRNTLTQKQFLGGGNLKILSAAAPRNLRRHTSRVLLVDEVDGMRVTKEGDPVVICTERTETYPDRKIIIGSTPTDEGISIILPKYRESDQRIFKMPCVNCGYEFELLWEHMHWVRGKFSTAVAICPDCENPIEERYKPEMVENGDWFVTNPDVQGHAGFRINRLISLFANASWSKLVERYERCERLGDAEMKVFYNTVLGRVWSNAIEYTNETQLMARVENFGICWDQDLNQWRQDIPPEVMFITCGVDTQHDRLELVFLGWTLTGRVVLGHEVIWGPTDLNSTWDELDSIITTEFKHPLGGFIGIEATAVDAGDGSRYQHVMDFCDRSKGKLVYGIKGDEGEIPVIKASKTSKRSGIKPLYIVGVDQVKTDIVVSLPRERDRQNSIRFSNSLTEEFFRQLTSQRREQTYKEGRAVVKFVTVENRRREGLDCVVYAIAIKHICRFNYEERLLELTQKESEIPSLRDAVSRLHS